jgi:hypothetical protein
LQVICISIFRPPSSVFAARSTAALHAVNDQEIARERFRFVARGATRWADILTKSINARSKAGDPPVSRSMMRMIGREFSVNDAATRRDLGYAGRTSRAVGLRSYG